MGEGSLRHSPEDGLATQADAWGLLDSYYIPTRYPNGLPGDIPARVYNAEAASTALSLTEGVVAVVEAWFAEAIPPPKGPCA